MGTVTDEQLFAQATLKQQQLKQVPSNILVALKGLFQPEHIIELRAFSGKITSSGFYDYTHFEQLATHAAKLSGKADGIYVTLNPVKPDLLAWAFNCIKEYPKHTTSDALITKRIHFLIDFDPKREPADISSTDEEHERALERALIVRGDLASLGWPLPINADSGNGGHLVYTIDLPNDDASKSLLSACLEALNAKFGDDKVAVDPTVFNASRISKLYGTLVRKGDNVPWRPHRYARILDAPTQEVVPLPLLTELANQAKPVLTAKVQTQVQLPSELKTLFTADQNEADKAVQSYIGKSFPHGTRNNALCSLGGVLRNLGLSGQEMFDQLQKLNQTWDAPADDKAVWNIVKQAENWDFAPASPAFEDYREKLQRNKNGPILANLANVLMVLRSDKAWDGVLAFNEFSLYTITKTAAPHQVKAGANWTDHDDGLTAEWMQKHGIQASSKLVGEAVNIVAKEHSFHPVRDYLQSLVWDKQPRLDAWLITYLGVEDSEFARAVGPRWLISAVARIMQPGCQVDHTLLLEGPQGLGKSTALRVLAGDDWFSDHISDLGSKDSRLELHGNLILEMSELDKLRHAELEKVKAFLTCRIDHFRPPYGRRVEAIPRSCVFAGTLNDQSPFTDETGNRRFWPVRCGTINIQALTDDRDQLWAEGFYRYTTGKSWYLETKELNDLAKEEQEKRYAKGQWDEVILEWLNDPKPRPATSVDEILPTFHSDTDKVTVKDIVIHAIGKLVPQITLMDSNTVIRCLIHNGWTKVGRSKKKETRDITFYVRQGSDVEI
jgi:predicted P-loop ATPase